MSNQSGSPRGLPPPQPSRWLLVALGTAIHAPLLLLVALAIARPAEPLGPALFALAGVFILVAIVLGLVHLTQDAGLSERRKVVWAALIVGFNVFTLPIYWWFHVVRSTGGAARARSQSSGWA